MLLAATAARIARADEAPGWTPDAGLIEQVETMAKSGAGTVARNDTGPDPVRVEVQVGKLDPRLKLAACAHIEPYLPPGAPVWGNTRMGLRCTQGAKLWNVSLPVGIHVYARALVVNTNLPSGTVLEAGQLAEGEVDLAAGSGPTVRQAALAVGRTLSRNLSAGAALRQADLKARQFFAAGETVRVIAGGAGWQVESEGEALNAGIEGLPARVRTGNGRIVNARPVGDRQVEILL
ncbi:MAG TPA: flagellar basal body P-ring formation chaperone FlgA [Burkholderiaceae bacterium]|nr:flagellar basal body P-ring formation chaperone FlgA [Burkholderiaceae bacterium]